MASLMPVAKQQYFDSNGVPLSGGKVYTYAAGTTSPLSTYSDKAGVTPNTNPVILDSRGEATIFWGNAGYKVVLKDSTDATIWTQDNLYAVQDSSSMTFAQELITATAGQTVFNLSISYTNGTNSLAVFCNGLRLNSTDYTETSTTSVTLNTGATVGDEFLFVAGDFAASTTGADLVTYTPAGTGAVATTVQAKLRESVSVKDFGAVGDGVTDDTAAIALAIASNSTYLDLYFPPGTYRLASSVVINRQNLVIRGAGRATTIYPDSGVTAFSVATLNGVSSLGINDIRFYGQTNATGAVSLGSTYFVAFCTMKNVSIENFSAVSSFGVKLSQVQELDIDDCYFYGNYNHIWLPNVASNYCTSTHIHGASGYIGHAGNVGILIAKETASLRISDIVVEGNASAGISIAGFGGQATISNVHFEAHTGPNAIYVSGDASRRGQFTIEDCFFYGNTVNLRADYAYIYMGNNTGLVDTGLIVPQTSCNLFFLKNKADDGSATDPITVYEALVASATVSYFDINNSGTPIQRLANLKFPATQVPSSDANTLDDYEEGTWTPSLVCGTSGTISLSTATGKYTKIGNLVTVFATIVVSGVAAPVGELRLSGLPFTVGASGGGTFAPFAYSLAATATTSLVGVATATANYAVISKYSAGGVANLAGDVQASTGIYASFSYVV